MDREDKFVEAMMSDANLLGSVYGKLDDDLLENGMNQERVAIAIS